jgi:hypothetical protein
MIFFVCQLENGRHKEEDASHESGEGRGRGLFPSYSLYFSQTISSRQIHGSNTKPFTHRERMNRKRPTLFYCRLIWLQATNSPPSSLTTYLLLLFPSLCVAGTAWPLATLTCMQAEGRRRWSQTDDSKKKARLPMYSF